MLLHDQVDPISVVSVWTRGNGTAGWHCEECGRGGQAGDCEAACRDAGAHRCPDNQAGERGMTSSWDQGITVQELGEAMTAYWNKHDMAAIARMNDLQSAAGMISASDLRDRAGLDAPPHREPSGRVCWGPHPPGQAWPCGCTPGPTRYGNLADIPDPGKRMLPKAGPARDRKDTASLPVTNPGRSCFCPPDGCRGHAVVPPDPPADCQEALHREVTGRTPAPTWDWWRDEFIAFGGDYARERMLSYVTMDTRCVTDPPASRPVSAARKPLRDHPWSDHCTHPVPRANAGLAWRPRIRDRKSALISAVAIAVILLAAAGAYTPAAVLIILLAVAAVVRW